MGVTLVETFSDEKPESRAGRGDRRFGAGAIIPAAEARERSDYSSIAPLIFETRSFPNSLFAYPGDFTFYVAHPDRSIRNGAKGI